MIEINNLSKIYPSGSGIRNITMTIGDHGVYGLLGVNGAGKSTLMNCITGYIGYTILDDKEPEDKDSCSTKDEAPNGALTLVPLQPKKI